MLLVIPILPIGVRCVLSPQDGAILPAKYRFSEKDGGIHTFEGVVLAQEGTFYITALDEEQGLAGRSNPITTKPLPIAAELYAGDLHAHSYFCDGYGTLEENYEWARDVRQLDFGAMSNHVEGAKRYDVDFFWPYVQEAAKRYNEPGRFVAFLGFEWGSWERFGDKCVYYLKDDQPCYGANEPASNTPAKLWQQLEDKKALTIPHHPKYGGQTDWSWHNPEYQRLVEIYSLWGDSEAGGEHSVQHALALGHKLGIIAGSDAHFTPLGSAGIAMVYAERLERESLFGALYRRHCYGTTGERILLWFQLNGRMMGEELATRDARLPREVEIWVAGTAELQRVELVRNNKVVYVYSEGGTEAELHWRDEAPLDEISLEGGFFEAPTTFYYVRVTQVNGEKAWSSPIWVIWQK